MSTEQKLISAMFLAVKTDNLKALKMVLATGESIKCTDGSRRTLLHACVINAHPSRQAAYVNTLNFLLENGVDPNAQDDEGGTALMYACRMFGDVNVVQLLLSYDAVAACMDNTQMTAYMFAASYNNAPALATLIATCGKHINACDSSGRTALHWAMLSASSECFRQIAQYSITNVCITDSNGETVLHYLARSLGKEFDCFYEMFTETLSRDTLFQLKTLCSADGLVPDEVAASANNAAFVDKMEIVQRHIDGYSLPKYSKKASRRSEFVSSNEVVSSSGAWSQGGSSTDSGIDEKPVISATGSVVDNTNKKKPMRKRDTRQRREYMRAYYQETRRGHYQRQHLTMENKVDELNKSNQQLTSLLKQLKDEAFQLREVLVHTQKEVVCG